MLDKLPKNVLPHDVKQFIRDCTGKYGKAKLVWKHNKFYVESEYKPWFGILWYGVEWTLFIHHKQTILVN